MIKKFKDLILLFNCLVLISCASTTIKNDKITSILEPHSDMAHLSEEHKKEIQPSSEKKQVRREDVLEKPAQYLKFEYHQQPVSPLLMRVRNTSPFDVRHIGLSSTLFDPDGNILEKGAWKITENIPPGAKSKFYLTPVTYHLAHEHQILTKITDIEISEE